MLSYKFFKDNGLAFNNIKKINNSYIISNDNYKYVVKEKKSDLDKKFNYLLSRSFNQFPKKFTFDKYDIYNYIEDKNISDEERLYEITNLISLLHTKTTRYRNTCLDDYKMCLKYIRSEAISNIYWDILSQAFCIFETRSEILLKE